MNSRLLLATLLSVTLGCSKGPSPQANQTSVPDGWAQYEDDMFRVSYPPNSEIVGVTGNKQNPSSPSLGVIPPPAAGKTVIGGFFLQLDTTSKGMLLRDGIEAELKRTKGDRGVVLSPPKEIPVANGRCLGTIVITPTSNCEKNAGSCFAPVFSMLCDAQNGARYTAGTVLSNGQTRDQLSPQAQQEAAVYERILRSLEFKKS